MKKKKKHSFIQALRTEHNFTQEEIAELTGYSVSTISRIERGTYTIPDDLLHKLSKIYHIDLMDIQKNSSNFTSINQYLLYYKLISSINSEDLDTMEQLLQHPEISILIQSQEHKYLIYYCKALVESTKYNQLAKALQHCYDVLEIDETNILYSIPNKKENHGYYSVLLIMTVSLKKMNYLELVKEFYTQLLIHLDTYIFYKFLPTEAIDLFFLKYYIFILNNFAHVQFLMKNYNESIVNPNSKKSQLI